LRDGKFEACERTSGGSITCRPKSQRMPVSGKCRTRLFLKWKKVLGSSTAFVCSPRFYMGTIKGDWRAEALQLSWC